MGAGDATTGPPVRRVLALLAVAAVLVVVVEAPGSHRPVAAVATAVVLGTLAATGYGVVEHRGRAWATVHVLVLLVLGLALAVVGGPTLGATLLLVVVVVQAVLLLPLPVAAGVVAVVPFVHVGMAWAEAWRAAFGTLVTAVFAAVVALLVLREQQARDRLARANDELRRLGGEVAGLAAAAERVRVAHDIHDGLGHHLTVVQAQVQAARAVLPTDPARADTLLASAQEQAVGALVEVRRSVRALRSPVLDGSLADALERLAAQASTGGLQTRTTVLGAARPLPGAVEEVLYRVGQEGLTNVRKHAGARSARLELDYSSPGAVRVRVADDGRGPVTDLAGGGSDGHGVGIVGLRERLAVHGGTLSLGAGPDGGSVLVAEVPG